MTLLGAGQELGHKSRRNAHEILKFDQRYDIKLLDLSPSKELKN